MMSLDEHFAGSEDDMLNQRAHASLVTALWEDGVAAQNFILFEIEGTYYLRASSGPHFMIDADFQVELDEAAFLLDSADCIIADGFLKLDIGAVSLTVRNHSAFFEPTDALHALQNEHPEIEIL